MNIRKVLITPAVAEEYLRKNNSNRKLSITSVNFYAQQMGNGLWKEETSETIKIAKDGSLLDGQHRLSALIKYGQAITFLIAEDLDPEVFTVLDTGKKRNAGDALTILGTEYAGIKAAGIASWFGLNKGQTIRESGGSGARISSKGLTNKIIIDEYLRRQEFWDLITTESHANYLTFNKTLTCSYIMAWRARLHDINPEAAKEFMSKVCNGLNMRNQYEPTYQLRNILMASKLSPTRRLDNKYKNAIMIKAWNNFYNKIENRTMSYNPRIEKYPVLVETPEIMV